jgi:hypothetical protein
MKRKENKIRELESSFPALSGSIFDAAREQALASGQDVVQSENGCLYKISPDHKKVRIKKIEPPTRMVSGLKIEIR